MIWLESRGHELTERDNKKKSKELRAFKEPEEGEPLGSSIGISLMPIGIFSTD